MISHILLHPSVAEWARNDCFIGNLCTENLLLSLDTPEECCQQQPDILSNMETTISTELSNTKKDLFWCLYLSYSFTVYSKNCSS